MQTQDLTIKRKNGSSPVSQPTASPGTQADLSQRGLGWLPDIPKPTDYTENHPVIAPLLAKTRLARAALAASRRVDLRGFCSPIEDQGPLGSCTAQAGVALLEYFERKVSGHFIDASRMFLYKATRDLLGWTGDTGAYLRSTMEALVLFGAPPERYWQYDIAQFDVEPPAFCFALGAKYNATHYFRLDPNGASGGQVLDNVKRMLAAGFPSIFGLPVFSEYDWPLPGGLVAFPAPDSNYRGGHANVAVGYDDDLMINGDKGALLVRNSWGTGWADQGYGWLSYRYLTESLTYDFWTMIAASWVDTQAFEM